MHTQRSDGSLPFEEAVCLYKEAGYDFLAVTDHWTWSETVKESDFLLLAGCEYDVGSSVQEGIYHIVAIACRNKPQGLVRRGPDLSAQQIIDAVHEENGIAILAHPSWSLNRVDEVRQLCGIDGTEIYNTFSGTPWNCRPYSGDFVDMMAADGRLLPCTAADDSHRYVGEETRSYIMVKAPELTAEAVTMAIRQGDFIATQGPMASLQIQDGYAVVECTEAEQVVFYSDAVWSGDRVTVGHGITRAQCRLQPQETFIRAEITDAQGRTAWTSPVSVK